MEGPPGTPTNKNEPVNKRASPQTKLFQGVRKLKADWASNMPLSLGGGRSTSTAENTITDSTAVDEKKQTERVHKEQEKVGWFLLPFSFYIGIANFLMAGKG